MSEDISKIISKYKMYMSFDGNEYEMIQKVELNKIFEEIERLHSIIKEVREYGKEVLSWTTNEPITDEIGEHILEIVDKENRE